MTDPWSNCFFSLEIDGTEVAHFLEWSGLKSSCEVFEIQEGGLNGYTHKMPGRSNWGTITLKYAVTGSTFLLEWRSSYLEDGFDSVLTGALVIRDEALDELRRYNFTRMWPVSWEGPQLNSGQSQLAIATFEFAFDGMTIGDAPPVPVPEPPAPEPEPIPEEIDMGTVQFAKNKDDLTSQGEETVDKVAEVLEENEDIVELWVEGHTCDLGSRSLNASLSADRAAACAERLQEQFPDRVIHSDGYAWDYPVRPNNAEANRAKNRRTQFFTTPRSGKRDGEIDYVDY